MNSTHLFCLCDPHGSAVSLMGGFGFGFLACGEKNRKKHKEQRKEVGESGKVEGRRKGGGGGQFTAQQGRCVSRRQNAGEWKGRKHCRLGREM